MNKKVFVTMLWLCIAFLAVMYVAKIFFPQEFVLAIENERIVAIGNFIDSNIVLTILCSAITSFITYWLFICACKRAYYLSWQEIVAVCAFIVGIRIISFVDANVATHISISSFFIIPLIFKHDLRIATVAYTIHGISQVLSLGIRNLPMYFVNVNSASVMCCAIDAYLWLLLIYLIFTYSKEYSYGTVDSPLLRKVLFLREEEGEGSPHD
jgi:hypothetical protein